MPPNKRHSRDVNVFFILITDCICGAKVKIKNENSDKNRVKIGFVPCKTFCDTSKRGCILVDFFISRRETTISRREMNIPKREMCISRREIKKLSVFVVFLLEYEYFLSVTFSDFVQ